MHTLLYVGLHDGRLYSSAAGATFNFPKFRARQTRTFALRFLNRVDGTLVEEDLHIRSLRASIGWIGLVPQSGSFKLKLGSAAPVVGVNTTMLMDWNAAQGRIESQLNALSSKPADFRVVKTSSGWLIGLVSGAAFELSVVENTLDPVSVENIEGAQISGEWWQHLSFGQTPLTATSFIERKLPPPPTMSTIIDGNTDPSGTYFVNEVQRFKLPADFRSLWCFERNGERTDLLSIEDRPERYKEMLDALLAREGASVDVRNPESRVLDIEFRGTLSGVDVAELGIFIPPASTRPGDYTFSLDLGLWPMLAALRDGDQKDVPFEVRADIVESEAAIEDPLAQGKEIVLFNTPVTILRPLFFPALSTVLDIPWQRGPAPKTYIPPVPSQILTGQHQAFPAQIGDGENTEWVIDHNLNSQVAYVVVRENGEDGRRLRDDEYSVHYASANSLTITFPVAPAENELLAFIVAIGPASVFQEHWHPIAQITGLQEYLDDIASRVSTLEDILPTISIGVPSEQASELEIPIPLMTEALFYKGSEKLEIKDDKLPTLPRRAPYMLPAIHTESNNTALPTPLPAPAAGVLWKNTSGHVVQIPGGGGLRGGTVSVGGYIGSDGRMLYPATRDGATKSYFPSAFERELFMFYVSEKMLSTRRMELVFAVQTALIGATSRASWLLEIQTGTAPQDTAPASTGPNLQDILWNATPILRERLVLSQELVTHSFGTRIKQTLQGMKCDVQNYGLWTGNDDAAPASPGFVLRARLINFDTENSQSLERGWVFYQLSGVVEGKAGGKLRAKIVN